MPRPEQHLITFQIDGREVQAPENMMLADAAKLGDIEIPVFCYEPKLGNPVGACRMCLVEIEGIPKLQTACSTAVKDGMVVHTQSERARVAQEAVVEFLLINHPLDCPVCDKGGECPLQDITFGWGGGRSRFIEPKRHFRKPLELSPLIAIDRERCILCYRCVRYSQEIAEDYQLILLERGAHSFVGTFDGHPYVAPFSGNIIELCPVGALTSRPYRFRARPWEIEGAGTLCTLCPAQCNVTLTVRDEIVMRVLERANPEVDDGWLCDKGRFAYQAVHADERVIEPMIRDGGELRAVSWERALGEAASALRRAGAQVAGLAGGGASNEEGLLLGQLVRGQGSPHLDSRPGGAVALEHWRALSDPELAARVSDLEFAHAVLVLDCEPVDDAPILELRIRKGVRRNRVALAVASERPSLLDAGAAASVRFAPGQGGAFASALAAAVASGGAASDTAAAAAACGVEPATLDALAARLREAGEEVVIVYGERLLDPPSQGAGGGGAVGLLALADALGLRGREGTGLIGIPDAANGRGLREVGVLPNAGPGLADPPLAGGLDAAGIGDALAAGELVAVHLLAVDPLRDLPDRPLWERALERASTVVAHASFLTDGIREHATVVFPAESSAEKEGTVTHPDGRMQRLRPAIARPGTIRAGWWALSELRSRLGQGPVLAGGVAASAAVFETVPFYGGFELAELAGHGVRWQERPAAATLPAAGVGTVAGASTASAAGATGASAGAGGAGGARGAAGTGGGAAGAGRARVARLRLATYRSIWAAPEVEASPALHFLIRRQQVELNPADAAALGVAHGERVLVSDEHGGAVEARVALRDAAPAGVAFLERGIETGAANLLRGETVEIAPAPELVIAVVGGDDTAIEEALA